MRRRSMALAGSLAALCLLAGLAASSVAAAQPPERLLTAGLTPLSVSNTQHYDTFADDTHNDTETVADKLQRLTDGDAEAVGSYVAVQAKADVPEPLPLVTVTYDLGTRYTLTRFWIQWNAYAQNLTLEGSADTASWSPLVTLKDTDPADEGSDGLIYTRALETQVRYLRVTFTDMAAEDWILVRELRVFGYQDGDQPATTTTAAATTTTTAAPITTTAVTPTTTTAEPSTAATTTAEPTGAATTTTSATPPAPTAAPTQPQGNPATGAASLAGWLGLSALAAGTLLVLRRRNASGS